MALPKETFAPSLYVLQSEEGSEAFSICHVYDGSGRGVRIMIRTRIMLERVDAPALLCTLYTSIHSFPSRGFGRYSLPCGGGDRTTRDPRHQL